MNCLQVNAIKQAKFIQRVYMAALNGEPFRIIAIDIDNTLVNEKPNKDRQIMSFAKKHIEEVQKRIDECKLSSNMDDYRSAQDAYFDLMDRILEEVDPEFIGKIDYDDLYCRENFFPHSIEYVNELIRTKQENDFVILLSHQNVDREYYRKIDICLQEFPEVDGIFLPKYHEQQYGILNRATTSKIAYLLNVLDVPSFYPGILQVCPDLIGHIYLIDDSQSVLKDAVIRGAKIIPFLPGYDSSKLGKKNLFEGVIAHAGCLSDLERQKVEAALIYHANNPLMVENGKILRRGNKIIY